MNEYLEDGTTEDGIDRTPRRPGLISGPAPDARALAETYWEAHQAVAPSLRGGPLPLDRLGPERVEATKAGALAVVAHALPSVAILDDALRAACEERDRLRSEVAKHRTRMSMLLADTPFEFRPDWEHEYDDAAPRDGLVQVPAEDDGVSVDIGRPEDGDYDRCEPAL